MPTPANGFYDLAVAYRIYPTLAKTASALPFTSKQVLTEECLQSFRAALGHLRAKVWVLLDGCPSTYADVFTKHFAASDLTLLNCDRVGNRATFAKQIEILTTQHYADAVYFAEDDYFYLPNALPSMLAYLRAHPDCDFVTPYDHPDCYTLDLHRQPKWLRLFDNHHWRSAASTCLTFLTTRATLKGTRAVFETYGAGNSDASLWLSLTKSHALLPQAFGRFLFRDDWLARIVAKSWRYGWRQILFGRKYRLWAPVPGLATHLDADALSPGIDWPSIFRRASSSSQPEVYALPSEALHLASAKR
jgi:hypothetical protein